MVPDLRTARWPKRDTGGRELSAPPARGNRHASAVRVRPDATRLDLCPAAFYPKGDIGRYSFCRHAQTAASRNLVARYCPPTVSCCFCYYATSGLRLGAERSNGERQPAGAGRCRGRRRLRTKHCRTDGGRFREKGSLPMMSSRPLQLYVRNNQAKDSDKNCSAPSMMSDDESAVANLIFPDRNEKPAIG